MECTKELIAPCGINCSVCSGLLRTKDACGAVLCVHKEACMTCGSISNITGLSPKGGQP